MKWHELEIRRFGALANRQIGPFSPGLNVLFGPNEAGKTTVFRFVRSVMHGFHHAQRLGLVSRETGTPSATTGAATTVSPGAVDAVIDGKPVRFERFVSSNGGRLQSEPRSPGLPAIAEPLAFFHPYEIDATEALVAASLAHGLELRAATWPIEELDRLQRLVETESARVATGPGESLQGLLAEHRKLVDRQRDLDQANRRRTDERTSQRTVVAVRQRALVTSLAEARTEREQLTNELDRLQREGETRNLDQCRRAADRTRQIDECLRTLAELDLRIGRMQDVIVDLDRRGVELQRDIERGGSAGVRVEDTTLAIRELETEVERLAAHRRTCRHCGGGHDSCCCDGVRSSSETLRERVYRLCEIVGRREVEARAIAAREERRELDCCRRGLRTQVELLEAERNREAESLASSGAFQLLGRAAHAIEFCTCDRHRAYLDELRTKLARLSTTTQSPPDTPDARQETGSALAELRQRIERLSERIAREEQQRVDVDRELARLGAVTRDDGDAEHLRIAIEDVRRRFARRAADRREFERQRRLVSDLRENPGIGRESDVIVEASANLSRMTLGHNPRLRVSQADRIEVLTASRGWADFDSLSAGTQHVVGLAFRLAVSGELLRRGSHVPLMLDDVLVDNDLDRQQAAVELLAEYADRGQQTILLTCHLHLREACRSRRGHVVEFASRTAGPERSGTPGVPVTRIPTTRPRPPIAPRPDRPTPAARAEITLATTPSEADRRGDRRDAGTARPPFDSISRTGTSTRDTASPPSITRSAASRADGADEVDAEAQASSTVAEFTLNLSDDVRRLPSMTKRQSRILGLAGIRTVGDLVDLEWTAHESLLSGHGVDRSTYTRWQSQAHFLVRVPGLRTVDASAMTELGLFDLESVRALTDAEFERRLSRLHSTGVGRGLLQSGRRFDAAWLRSLRERARRARSLNDAGRGRTSRSRRQGRRRNVESEGRPSRGSNRSLRRTRPNRNAEHDGQPDRTNRNRLARDASETERLERERLERERVERQQTERAQHEREEFSRARTLRTDDHVVRDAQASASQPPELRFYLSRSAPLVDAPSIGPKTAERFKKVGLTTVDDFLNADPDDVAKRVNKRHITPETIRQWQAQSRLVCRVPELRGHDAQILVACEIDDPEALAAAEPRTLLARVTPFCKSAAGKRIIRSGKAPDLDEVTAWIHWSRKSRTLRAA